MTTSDYLTQLQQDKEDLVDNLETMGITGLTGDETFTELVPEVLNIPAGANLDDYFKTELEPTYNTSIAATCIKRLPTLTVTAYTTDIPAAFKGISGLIEAPTINNFSIVRNIGNLFNGCSSLQTAPNYDLKDIQYANQMFASCYNLKNVPVYTLTNMINMNNMYLGCTQLTDESINNILESCTTTTSAYTQQKTLSALGFSSSSYSASHIATLSNYQDFINAGWTIGY